MIFQWKLMFFLISFKSVQAVSWYVSNSGHDNNECGSEENTCKHLQTTIKKMKDEDLVYLVAKHEHDIFDVCRAKMKPIVIQKSITISGLDFIPMIKCDTAEFMFLIEGSNNKVSVKFEDAAFENEDFPRNYSCKATQNGVIKVVNANISIIGCYFKRICTALLVTFDNGELYSVKIHSTEFNCISFALYSTEIYKGNVSIDSMQVIGIANEKCTKTGAITLVAYKYLELKIINSIIKRAGVAIHISTKSALVDMKLNSVIISENRGQGMILKFGENKNRDKSKIMLENVEFVENNGAMQLADHWADKDQQSKKVKVYVTDCKFYDNKADTLYGTIHADGVFLHVESSVFENNVAGIDSLIQGFGGALYVEKRTNVVVLNSTFVNNTCSGFGGTVFSRGNFSCINCEFTGPSNILIRPLLGDILYATAGLNLINTTWKSTVMKEIPRPLIWHPGSPILEDWDINISGYFNVTCPEGHNITYYGVMKRRRRVSRVTMSCKPCPVDQYSLTSGTLNVWQKNGSIYEAKRTIANCHHCKYGGVCEKGVIRPRPSYYGYRTGPIGDEVQFISCPAGYCCQGDSCQKYNSCQKHREGTLCGKCKTGMSENLINSNCAHSCKCKDHWFWIFYLPFGILYILTFTYLDKISLFIKQQLIWWEQKLHHKHDLEEYEIITAQHAESAETEARQVDEIDDISMTSPVEHNSRESQSYPYHEYIFQTPGETIRGPDLFTDILEISFYFYQMFLLIRRQESVVLDHVLFCIRSFYGSIFTLSIKIDYSMFHIPCPIRGLTAVTKLLFENAFACYVLILLLLMHIVVYGLQNLVPQQELYRQEEIMIFSIRLKVATIQILLLSYSTLSETAVTLVNCVPLTQNFVLMIDGTITCYTWWQMFIFVFVLTWVIPFPVVMVFSTIHLKKDRISYHQFVLAWVFPFAYVIRLLIMLFKPTRSTNINSTTHNHILNQEERLSVEEILFQLECPYVGESKYKEDRTNGDQNNCTEQQDICEIRQPVFWQGAMIARRLILILVLTFINNPVSKYYSALFLCVVYLVHQLNYRPYILRISNIYEMITSVTLVLFCSMNLFFAYSYISDTPPEAADENLSILFRWLEAVILVLLPTCFALALFCLVVTRLVVLLFKLVKNICNCLNQGRT